MLCLFEFVEKMFYITKQNWHMQCFGLSFLAAEELWALYEQMLCSRYYYIVGVHPLLYGKHQSC